MRARVDDERQLAARPVPRQQEVPGGGRGGGPGGERRRELHLSDGVEDEVSAVELDAGVALVQGHGPAGGLGDALVAEDVAGKLLGRRHGLDLGVSVGKK